MTDLEITRLCAEAMILPYPECVDTAIGPRIYEPLHDDAQAMALVKKFRIRLLPNIETQAWMADMSDDIEGIGPTLNHAICECVAKMQQAKK